MLFHDPMFSENIRIHFPLESVTCSFIFGKDGLYIMMTSYLIEFV